MRLCPELAIVEAHMNEYGRVSALVMAVLHQLTPLVEQISIDEAFLDVSSLPQPLEEIARQLQAQIRDDG